MKVRFDPIDHKYYINEDKEVPSVTQLVAPLGADYDDPDDMLESVLDAATDRGETMHAYIEHRLDGGQPEDFELPSMYQPYADAVELFLDEHAVKPIAIEEPMAARGFAGKPDLICNFDDKGTTILDWKFVSQVAKSKVGAQLAGYRMLCFANGLFPDYLAAVQFRKDGTYRIYPVALDRAEKAFWLCRAVYNEKHLPHPRGRIFDEGSDILWK